MTEPLSEPRPTTTAGQWTLDPTHNPLEDAIREAAANVASDLAPTSFRDDRPVPAIGSTPPVAQHGRPPMTAAATGASVMLIAGGFFSLCLGGAVSAVMYFSHNANETVVLALCSAPPVTFVALGALVKKVKKIAPDEHHHYYDGPVYQDHSETTNNNRWWGKSSTRT